MSTSHGLDMGGADLEGGELLSGLFCLQPAAKSRAIEIDAMLLRAGDLIDKSREVQQIHGCVTVAIEHLAVFVGLEGIT